MAHPTDLELRKRARDCEQRRNFGVVTPITLTPPDDDAIYKSFTLASGNTYRPNFRKGGRVIVSCEADAIELQREGWTRE